MTRWEFSKGSARPPTFFWLPLGFPTRSWYFFRRIHEQGAHNLTVVDDQRAGALENHRNRDLHLDADGGRSSRLSQEPGQVLDALAARLDSASATTAHCSGQGVQQGPARPDEGASSFPLERPGDVHDSHSR